MVLHPPHPPSGFFFSFCFVVTPLMGDIQRFFPLLLNSNFRIPLFCNRKKESEKTLFFPKRFFIGAFLTTKKDTLLCQKKYILLVWFIYPLRFETFRFDRYGCEFMYSQWNPFSASFWHSFTDYLAFRTPLSQGHISTITEATTKFMQHRGKLIPP